MKTLFYYPLIILLCSLKCQAYSFHNHFLPSTNSLAGTYVVGLSSDADFADLGAYEFTPPANDAGIIQIDLPSRSFMPTEQPVQVVLKNFGTNPLTTADLKLAFNDKVVATNSWIGNLTAGAQETVSLTDFTFADITAYDFVAWSESPNGNADSTNHNAYQSEIDVFARYPSDDNRLAFSEWQTSTTLDQHSEIIDPYFTSDDGFAVENQLLNQLTDAPLDPSIIIDIREQIRATNTPTAGAFEVLPMDYDLRIVNAPTLEGDFPVGTRDIEIVVENIGQATIEHITVEWEVDGVMQNLVNWVGTLAAGANTTINLGTFDFNVNTEHDFTFTAFPTNDVDAYPLNNQRILENIIARLGGVYSVGGNMADFIDVQAALVALQGMGVMAPVTFNINDGSYTINYILNNYYGNSPTNTVAFIGNSHAVILNTDRNFGARERSGITIQEVSSISFEQITFVLTDFITAPLTLFNQIEHLKVQNCRFESQTNREAYSFMISLNFIKGIKKCLIENCYFAGSETAISLNEFTSSSLVVDNAILIQKNQFVDQHLTAINVTGASMATFKNNDISLSADYTRAIVVDRSAGVNILSNTIRVNSAGGTVIRAWRNESSVENPTVIANNFIEANGAELTALYIMTEVRTKVLHNTVIGSHYTSLNNEGAYIGNVPTEVDILGNNLFNSGGGRSVIHSRRYDSMDYNNYYTNGDYLVANEDTGERYATLEEWQMALPAQNQASVNVNPLFTPANSYQFNNPALQNVVPTSQLVPDDIEENTRPTELTDMGCYERMVFDYDVGIVKLIVPQKPFAAGMQPIQAEIQNYGSQTLTSIDLHWTFNEELPVTTNWTGSLASNETTIVNLGEREFMALTGHNIALTAVIPNETDAFPINNSTDTTNLFPALIGDYRIGNSAVADMNDFTTATNALYQGGIIGEVRLNIEPATYTESIILDSIVGTAADQRIIFQPLSMGTVILKNATPISENQLNSVVYLNQADYITFRNLTFAATAGATNIQLTRLTDHIVVENNIFNGEGLTDHITFVDAINNRQLSNRRSTGGIVSNNEFIGGRHSIVNNNLPYTGSIALQNWLIKDNQFLEMIGTPIRLGSVYTTQIRNNLIYNPLEPLEYGIYVDYVHEQLNIQANKLMLDGCYIAIHVGNSSPSAQLIASNNLIVMGERAQWYRPNFGFSIERLRKVNIVYNTILLNTSSYIAYAIKLYGISEELHLMNNIVELSDRGSIIDYYRYYNILENINHNVYYQQSTQFGYLSREYQSLNTFSDWQTQTTFDQQSIFADPQLDQVFYPANTAVHNQAMPTTAVIIDIEGKPRSLGMPDAGIYEDSAQPCGEENDICQNPLAVVQINFDVIPMQQSVQLRWKLPNFTEVNRIEIWRSEKEIDLQLLHSLSTNLTAPFTDLDPATGDNYYQIKAYYLDGTSLTSDIKQVYFDQLPILTITPNPAGEVVQFSVADWENEKVTLTLYDAIGQVVLFKSKITLQNINTIDMSTLPTGTYTVQVRRNNTVLRNKVLKTL